MEHSTVKSIMNLTDSLTLSEHVSAGCTTIIHAVAEYKKVGDALEAENQDLKEQMCELKKEKQLADEALAELRKVLGFQYKLIADKAMEGWDLRDQIEALSDRVEFKAAELAKKTKEIERLQAMLSEAKIGWENHGCDCNAEIEAQNIALADENHKLRGILKEEREERKVVLLDVRRLSKDAQGAQREIQVLKKELMQIEAEHEKEEGRLLQRIKDLGETMDDVRNDLCESRQAAFLLRQSSDMYLRDRDILLDTIIKAIKSGSGTVYLISPKLCGDLWEMRGRKIDQIKIIRKAMDLSLRSCKEIVDAIWLAEPAYGEESQEVPPASC